MASKLYDHRDGVREQYWQQGYLGRFVVYLIDRIIQASLTSAKIAAEDKRVASQTHSSQAISQYSISNT